MPPRKAASPKTAKASELPRASFRKVDDDVSTKPAGVHDQQARSYGYNDFDDFERPDYYIRHIEPIESELATQVEYDMDEQDQEWLEALNEDRKKDQMDKVSYETFEILMDRLEKEWFDLIKRVPKRETEMPPEDSTCAVCDDGEGENSNAIVFCDGCNLAVHQECYGVPYIPEGQWLCRKCTVSPENPVHCAFCPAEAGAFKQSECGRWVHLLCAMFIPEVSVLNSTYMEPIESLDRVQRGRWKLTCSLCNVKEGACVQCQKPSCVTAFHVTCARRHGLLSPMKSLTEDNPLQQWCERHLPADLRESRRFNSTPPSTASALNPQTPKSTKTALAHSSGYAPSAPIVPNYIVDRLLTYIAKIIVRKKREFVCAVCRYWSLKREARRGAPLLKRLHLEPWTASSSGRDQTDEQKERKLAYLCRLRSDIERVRLLAEYVVKREAKKLRRAEELRHMVEYTLFPHEHALEDALSKVVSLDRLKLFNSPVSRTDVPDYYNIVKNPMDWTEMTDKLKRHEYLNVDDFQADVNLVFDNSMLYNAPATQFFKQAVKLKAQSAPFLAALEHLKQKEALPDADAVESSEDTKAEEVTMNGTNGTRASHVEGQSPASASSAALPLSVRTRVNDLETPLETLLLLHDTEAIAPDVPFILSGTPVDSAFRFGLSELKPPPPPPPPRPPKPKRDRAQEKERRRLEREKRLAEDNERGRLAMTFEGRRTRNARKQAAAFEAEANGSALPGDVDVLPGNHKETVAQETSVGGSDLQVQPEQATGDGSAEDMPPSAEETRADDPDVDVENASEVPLDETHPAPGEGSGPPGEVGASQDVPLPEQKPSRKRKRHGADGPAIPPVVGDVNDLSSFRHFETGWVLEERTRSRNRPQPKDADEGPARKKAKTETTSQAAEHPLKRGRRVRDRKSSTLRVSRPDPEPLQEGPAAPDHTTPQQRESVADDTRLPSSDLTDLTDADLANRPVIIDDEDGEQTPKPLPRMLDETGEPALPFMDAVASPVEEQSKDHTRVHPNVQGRKRGTKGRFLSDVPVQPGANPTRRRPPRIDVKPNAISDADASKVFVAGTLVWAKMETFPWFPAEIYPDDDTFNAPKDVLKAKSEKERKAGRPVFLTRFYDRSESWQWLPPTNLYLLGEDSVLDNACLDKRVFRSGHQRQQVRSAWKRAMAEMETPEDSNRAQSTFSSAKARGEAPAPDAEGDIEMAEADGDADDAEETEEEEIAVE